MNCKPHVYVAITVTGNGMTWWFKTIILMGTSESTIVDII